MPFIVINPATATVVAGGPYGSPAASGYKSFLDLKNELRFDLGSRTDIESQLGRWINDAYLDMASSLDIPEPKVSFSFTTVALQPFYKLPAGVGALRLVSVYESGDPTDGYKLDLRDTDYWRLLPDTSGAPLRVMTEQGVLILHPTPDTAYTVVVDAKVLPVKLTADANYPIFSQEYHEPLLKLAKAKAWESLQNDEKALTTEGSMSRQITRKQTAESGTQQNSNIQLRPIFSKRGFRQLSSREDEDGLR
jgi:hypothetical protein